MINSPRLRRGGATELELPQIQNNYSIESIFGETEVETLDGTLRTDTGFYKDGLVIKYDAVPKTSYIEIVGFIRDAIVNNQIVEFQFEKLSNYSSYRAVKVRISDGIEFVGGSGLDVFFYSFDLIIKDISAR